MTQDTVVGRRRAEPEDRFRWWRRGAITLLVLGLVAAAVVVGALSFSVRVSGLSMAPTLAEGDRLFARPWKGSIERFDLVEANVTAAGTTVVKRVIGLPGDTVQIVGPAAEGSVPVVRVRPAGSTTWYRVDNPTWTAASGDATKACCSVTGTSDVAGAEVTVPDGQYWLLGDNFSGSTDSRVFGFVEDASILTRLTFRVLPLSRFGSVDDGARLVPEGG